MAQSTEDLLWAGTLSPSDRVPNSRGSRNKSAWFFTASIWIWIWVFDFQPVVNGAVDYFCPLAVIVEHSQWDWCRGLAPRSFDIRQKSSQDSDDYQEGDFKSNFVAGYGTNANVISPWVTNLEIVQRIWGTKFISNMSGKAEVFHSSVIRTPGSATSDCEHGSMAATDDAVLRLGLIAMLRNQV